MHDLLKAYATQLAQAHDAEPDRRAAVERLIDYYLGATITAMNAFAPMQLAYVTGRR